MSRRRGFLLVLGLALAALPVAGPPAPARQKKHDGPQVLVAAPLGVVPGVPAKVTVRGLKLVGATAVRFADARLSAMTLERLLGLARVAGVIDG